MEDHESAPLLQLPEKGGGKPSSSSSAISLVATSGSVAAAAAPPAGSGGASNAAPPEPQLPAAPGTLWGVTACLLLADMVGVGSLSLPSVFARLGWVTSFAFLALFSVGCGYLGVLFAKLGVAVPTATAFDEIGSAALGKLGRGLVYSLVYTTIFVGGCAAEAIGIARPAAARAGRSDASR